MPFSLVAPLKRPSWSGHYKVATTSDPSEQLRRDVRDADCSLAQYAGRKRRTILPAMVHALKHLHAATALCHGCSFVATHL